MKSKPVSGKERIITLDVIRGVALFGIFLVNMPAFHSPGFLKSYYGVETDFTGADYWVDIFFALFIDMKFFTIFSFLFGLGFYIFMSRAEEKGLGIKRLYLRRIFALLLFGVAHLVGLWFGDILHTYAIAGLLLLFFYKRKIKTMIIWAFSLLFIINVLFSFTLLVPGDILQEMQDSSAAEYNRSFEEYMEVYENAGYAEWVSYRLGTEVSAIVTNLVPAMIPVLAMFLFGLAAGKAGVFQDVAKHLKFLRKIRFVTLLISLPLVVMLALFKLDIIDLGIKQEFFIQVFTSLSGTSLCFFYISALTLMLNNEKWRKRLRPLGFTGQMALTIYLSQTLISIGLFVGLGFYGDVSLLTGTFICIVIFAAQIIFSTFWLQKFRFGPLEWLWRSFTYAKLQPMKKEKAEGVLNKNTLI